MQINFANSIPPCAVTFAQPSQLFPDDCTLPTDDKSLNDFLCRASDKCLKALSQQDKLKLLLQLNMSELDDNTIKKYLTRLYKFLDFSSERNRRNKELMNEFCAAIIPHINEWEKQWDRMPVSEKLRVANLMQLLLARTFGGNDGQPAGVEPSAIDVPGQFGGYSWSQHKIVLNYLDNPKKKSLKFSDFLFSMITAGVNHMQNLKSEEITPTRVLRDVMGAVPYNTDEALLYLSLRRKCYVASTAEGPITSVAKESEGLAVYFMQRLAFLRNNILYVK